MIMDADLLGVQVAWSPGALTGRHGRAGSDWRRSQDPVSELVLGAERTLMRLGRVDRSPHAACSLF